MARMRVEERRRRLAALEEEGVGVGGGEVRSGRSSADEPPMGGGVCGSVGENRFRESGRGVDDIEQLQEQIRSLAIRERTAAACGKVVRGRAVRRSSPPTATTCTNDSGVLWRCEGDKRCRVSFVAKRGWVGSSSSDAARRKERQPAPAPARTPTRSQHARHRPSKGV